MGDADWSKGGLRLRFRARLLGAILATGGVAAAHALVQPVRAQEPPPPTVTTPTEPAPTVPAPSTPTPTVPTPPPVRLAPAVTAPSARLAPAPPEPAEITVTVEDAPPPAPRATSRRSRWYVAPTPAPRRSFEPDTAAGARRPVARPRAFEATIHRTSQRVSVRVTVRIPKARRAFLVVRGPAPSCRRAGYIPMRGARTVYFAGRVHGRRLGSGIYRISPSPDRRAVYGAPTAYVRVVSTRRSVPVADSATKPACKAAPAANPVVRKATARPRARVAGVVASEKPSAERRDETAVAALPVAGGVLGEATEEAEREPFLAIAMLALVAGLLLAMVALVTKFLRGSWNP